MYTRRKIGDYRIYDGSVEAVYVLVTITLPYDLLVRGKVLRIEFGNSVISRLSI